MNEEKKKRNKIIGISIGIFVVLLVVISSTYAYWQITKSQNGSNDIIAACLDIDMQSVDGTFGLNPAWPISDSEGMNLTGYKFKVTNKCEEDVNYVIGMDSLEVSGATYLSYDSIKVSMDNAPAMIYGKQEDIDHIEAEDTYTIRDSKKIATSVVKNGQPNEHIVKVWIKSDAPVEEQSRVFSGRMFITGGQNIENDKPLAKLIATGDISRTEDCKDDGAYGYNCTPVTGNDVNYYFYSDGTLKLTGKGATKQYLYPNPSSSDGLAPLLSDIVRQYIEVENIELTEEESNLLADGSGVPMIIALVNDNPLQLEEYMDEEDSVITANDVFEMYEEYDATTASLLKSIVAKLSNFPKMTDIIIDDGITAIGDNVFYGMLFENLIMSDTVLEIGTDSFSRGGFTKSYKFSNNLQTIGNGAFSGLVYTGSLVIPDTVSTLPSFFAGAEITEVILPKNPNVTSIQYGALAETTSLVSIVIPENIVNMSSAFAQLRDKSKVSLKFYGPERTVDGLDTTLYKEVIWNYQN